MNKELKDMIIKAIINNITIPIINTGSKKIGDYIVYKIKELDLEAFIYDSKETIKLVFIELPKIRRELRQTRKLEYLNDILEEHDFDKRIVSASK